MKNSTKIKRLRGGLDYEVILRDLEREVTIDLLEVDSPSLPEQVHEHVDRKWEESRAKSPSMYDGPLLGVNVEGIRREANQVIVPVYNTNFRFLLGTRFNQIPGFAVYTMGVGGLTSLISDKEEFFLFGERSTNTASVGGQIDAVPQGFVDREDIEKGAISSILREYSEEIGNPLGLTLESQKREIQVMNLVKTSYFGNVVGQYLVNLGERNLKGFDKKGNLYHKDLGTANEHSRIYAVPKKELADFALRHNLGVAARFRVATYLEANE